VVAAFNRSAVAGWAVIVSLPEAAFSVPLERSLWIITVSGTLLAALAVALALGFARHIARPIQALAQFAVSGGAGQLLATPVREVNAVAHVLAAAEADRRRRTSEREALLAMFDLAQILVREPSGRIRLWTAGMERLLGRSRPEAPGQVSHVLLATEFPCPMAETEAELLASGEWRGELCHRRADGGAVVVASHWALRR
jgi:PAS domain-containing protein